MRLLFGSQPRPFALYATKRYFPEELEERVSRLIRARQPVYLEVEAHRIALTEADVHLAAAVASSYHNQVCYNAPSPDSWDEDTAMLEARAREHMEAPSSPEDSNT
jgi:hypothetical protein